MSSVAARTAENRMRVSLRRMMLGRAERDSGCLLVESDGLANERLEGRLVNLHSFVDVDRTADVSFETGVEETAGILQGCALGEGQLHGLFVGLASADDAVVGP